MTFQLFTQGEALQPLITAQSNEHRDTVARVIRRLSMAARTYCGTSGKSTQQYKERMRQAVAVLDRRKNNILCQRYNADQLAFKHYIWCCEKKLLLNNAAVWQSFQNQQPERKEAIAALHSLWEQNAIFAEYSSRALRDVAEQSLPFLSAYFTFAKREWQYRKGKIKKPLSTAYDLYIKESTASLESYYEAICGSIMQRMQHCYENNDLSCDNFMTSFVAQLQTLGLVDWEIPKVPASTGMSVEDYTFFMSFFEKHASEEQKLRFEQIGWLQDNENYQSVKTKKYAVLVPSSLVALVTKRKRYAEIFRGQAADLIPLRWLDRLDPNQQMGSDNVFHRIHDFEKVQVAISAQKERAKKGSTRTLLGSQRLWGLFHRSRKAIYQQWSKVLDGQYRVLQKVQSDFYCNLLADLGNYPEKDRRKLYRKAAHFFQGLPDDAPGKPVQLLDQWRDILVRAKSRSQAKYSPRSAEPVVKEEPLPQAIQRAIHSPVGRAMRF